MTLPWSSALRTPALRISLLLHAVLAVALCFVPLFDSLGFERAFVTGLLSAFTSPAVAFAMMRRARLRGGADPVHLARRALALNLALLLPSVFAGWLVEAFTQSCDQQAGLLFMLLVAGGNVAFGSVLGLLVGALTPRSGVALALMATTHAGFLAVTLSGLYTDPQIFAYCTPLGFWPGSLYDEELTVTPALWAFRGYTLLFTGALLAALSAFTNKRSLRLGGRLGGLPLLMALLLTAATLSVYRSGRELGFRLDESSVQEALSLRLETEHFIIYAAPSLQRAQAERLKADHELRWAQLDRFFGSHPEGKITSYVYANVADKARLMGAGRTQIARPWANQIHIHGFSVPHRVLKHELAHIFAGSLAKQPFRVPTSAGVFVNIGVVEGIAVAADWPAHELTVHGWTRAMRSLGLAPDMRKILSPMGFWSVSSGQAYTVAGSFVRYLVETEGMERFAHLYADNDFHAAYGKDLDQLVTEWERFIDALPLPKGELIIAEHRFKRPSIFQKVCAHQAANLAQRGQQRLRGGDLQGGLRDLEALAAYSPNDPEPWVIMAQALARQGELEQAQTRITRALQMTGATQKSTGRAREAEGGILWRLGETTTASAAFSEVLSLHLSTPSDRLQTARLHALSRPPEAQSVLRDYLLSDLPFTKALVLLGKLSRSYPHDGLLLYLYGRALEQAQAHPDAAVVLHQALQKGLPSEALRAEAELTLGRNLLWAGSSSAAADRFSSLARRPLSQASALSARDWWARARFAADGRLPSDPK